MRLDRTSRRGDAGPVKRDALRPGRASSSAPETAGHGAAGAVPVRYSGSRKERCQKHRPVNRRQRTVNPEKQLAADEAARREVFLAKANAVSARFVAELQASADAARR